MAGTRLKLFTMLLLDPLPLFPPLFFHRQQREQEKWFRGIKTVAEKKKRKKEKKKDEKRCAPLASTKRGRNDRRMEGNFVRFRRRNARQRNGGRRTEKNLCTWRTVGRKSFRFTSFRARMDRVSKMYIIVLTWWSILWTIIAIISLYFRL